MDDYKTDIVEVDNTAEEVISNKIAQAKRTNAQAENLKVEISKLLVRGFKPAEIAERKGIELHSVRYYIKVIEDEWKLSLLDNMDKFKSREIAKIDAVEQEAWESWEKSKQGRTKDQVNAEVNVGRDGTVKRNPRVSRTIKESSVGDSRFLEIVFKCIEKRIAIIGLDIIRAASNPGVGDGDINVLEQRIARYKHVITEDVVSITVSANQNRTVDQHDPGEPLDPARSPRKTNAILDTTGSVR